MAPAFIADNETEGEVLSKIGKNEAKNKCHQLLFYIYFLYLIYIIF